MRTITAILFTFVFLIYHNQVNAGDAIEQGIYAFEQGHYELTKNKLMPFAKNGNAQAQYYVGLLYLNGYAVKQSQDLAIQWLKKSAQQNLLNAKKKLEQIKVKTVGLTH